jgi:hypothetical protein
MFGHSCIFADPKVAALLQTAIAKTDKVHAE